MDHFFVFSCLLAVVAGVAAKFDKSKVVCNPNLPPNIYSKRDAIVETLSPVTTEDLYQLINKTLKNTSEGISGEDLKEAAQNIQDQADAILEARLANVSHDDVRSLVQDIVTRYQINSSAADIIDDPLTEDVKKITIALELLFILRLEGLNSEGYRDMNDMYDATGESANVIVTAISVVAEVLENSITNAEMIVRFIEASQHPDDGDDDDADDDEARNINKRKDGSLEISYSKEHGWDVKFNWDWKR